MCIIWHHPVILSHHIQLRQQTHNLSKTQFLLLWLCRLNSATALLLSPKYTFQESRMVKVRPVLKKFSISSRVRPLVSGTHLAVKIIFTTEMTQKNKKGAKSP